MAHFYQIPNVKSYVVLHSNRTQPQNLRSAKKKMAPLKSLEQVCALIDSNFQTFCASHGIFTGTFFFFPFDFDSIFNIKLHHFDLLPVEDFLIHDLYVLAAFAEQQPASEKLKQVKTFLTVSISLVYHSLYSTSLYLV